MDRYFYRLMIARRMYAGSVTSPAFVLGFSF